MVFWKKRRLILWICLAADIPIVVVLFALMKLAVKHWGNQTMWLAVPTIPIIIFGFVGLGIFFNLSDEYGWGL